MGLYQDVKELVDGKPQVALNDGAGVALTSTLNGGKQSLDVNITSASTTGAVVDGTPFVADVDLETPIGGVFNDSIAALTSGDSGGIRSTANRGLHVNLRNAAGAAIGVSGAALIVDGSAVTQPVSAASLPLPTGAATEATLAALNGKSSPATAALSSVAASVTTVSILASNAARKGFVLVNDSASIVYVAFAATATATAFTYMLKANSVVESPNWVYTGAISGIWVSAVGSLRVTELS